MAPCKTAAAEKRKAVEDAGPPPAANKTKAKATPAATSVKTKAAGKRKATDDADPPPPTKKTKAKATPLAAPAVTTTARGKRKVADDADAAPPLAKKAKALTHGPIINNAPTERLNVYVFGEGSSGELGLGNTKKPPSTDVKRPRLNPHLDVENVGAVQVVAGGMHTMVLTHDNKILTWGVNDQGALGRDTTWEGKTNDMDAKSDVSDSDDDENGTNDLNPREATPGEVDFSGVEIAPGTRFTQMTAGDSCSFVLTDDGKVYGWGTFRGNDGIIGFTPDVKIASRPILIQGLKDITLIKAGENHCFALDKNGKTYSWGTGQQDQLGRRIIERTAKSEGLKPRQFGLPSGPKNGVVAIESGAFHGFALTKDGNVYAWGLNAQGATGLPDFAGEDGSTIRPPRIVEHLRGKNVVDITGANAHSIACTASGDVYIWGRADGNQMGIPMEILDNLPETDCLMNSAGTHPRIVHVPQKVPGIKGAVSKVCASGDHNIVVTKDGKAWSWGFSANYQTGLGTDEEILVPTMIDNTAIREKHINGATSGGQFGILTAPADVPMVNGA